MEKHPHLFAGAISSSGVIKAIYSLPEFDTHTFAAAGTDCGRAIMHAM